MKRLGMMLVLALLLGTPAAVRAEGQTGETAPGSLAGAGQMLRSGWDWLFRETDKERQRQLRGLHLYKQNYAIFTWGSEAEHGSDSELKFQLSARQHVVGPVLFAYTQKSFWRVWDGAGSRPFRETNYNPEIFLRTRVFHPRKDMALSFDICPIEHESNGQAGAESRSWNRAYLQPRIDFGPVDLELKTWFRWSEDEPRFPNDPQGDENRDIQDFYGNHELRLGFDLPARIRLELMERRNFSSNKGAVEASLEIPLSRTGNGFIYVQFWDGYGESLIDYNRSLTSYGVGFSLRPSGDLWRQLVR